MKSHPRIRKTVKWGGLVVTVLLVVVWIASQWVAVNWCVTRDLRMGIVSGSFRFGTYRLGGNWIGGDGLEFRRPYFGNVWWFSVSVHRPHQYIYVPLWFPAGIALVITAAALRLDSASRRREREWTCPMCGYDRAGLASVAVCPECGKGVEL